MHVFAKLGVLFVATVLLLSCRRDRDARFVPDIPAAVDAPVSGVNPAGAEVRATRWYTSWAISAHTKTLMGVLANYEGRFLQKGAGDILSLATFDKGDPNIADDEECLYAWFEIPPVNETHFPRSIGAPETSAKSCSCAWGVCREVESSGHVRLISMTDTGVIAEVALTTEEWQIVHRGTFSPGEPHEAYTETFEIPKRR